MKRLRWQATASAAWLGALLTAGAAADAGPRLVLIPQRSVPMVSCTVLVPAGSALETPETNGAAHYLEHLLFNGTTTRTREQIYSETDLLGAYNNASTQRERTVFQLLLPSENWREGLALQADMLLRSTLPPTMFEKEKGIILEELAKDRTNPEYEAERFVQRVLWGEDPRALPVLGTEESISGMDPGALAKFYQERYRPEGFTIVLMGDIDEAEGRAELERLFGKAEGDGATKPVPPRPAFLPESALHRHEITGLGKTSVTLMLPMPAVSLESFAAARLLATVLSDGEQSAVSRAVEAAGATVLSAGASLEAGEPWSLLAVSVDVAEGGPSGEAVVQAILAHLVKLVSEPSVAHDLPAAQRTLLVEDISLREKMHYYGLMRADLLDGGDPSIAESLLVRTRTCSEHSVREVLRDALASGQILTTTVGPGAGDAMTPLTVPPVPADVRFAMVVDGAPVGPLALPPSRPAVTEPESRRIVLPNGLTLIHQASPDARTFAVHVLFKDRAELEEQTGVPRGTSDVIHRMMALGTATLDENRLRGRLAELGTSLKVTDADGIPYDDYYFSPEHSYVRLETIDSFGLDALALLGEIVVTPRLTEETLDKARTAAATRAEAEVGSPRSVAERGFLDALGANHPESGGVLGSAAAIRGLTLEQVTQHHAAMTAPERLVLAVSSNLPYDAIEEAVTRGFPSAGGGEPLPARDWHASGEPARHETPTGREQSWILLGAPLDVPSADEAALRVAVAVLSERLAEELREREGLAYSIGAGARLESPGAYIRMSAGTRPENLERMEEGMLRVAAELAARPPAQDELTGARNRDEGRRRMRRLTRIGQAHAMAMAELAGRSPTALDADLPALRSVTPEDVARVASAYLRFEPRIVSVAR
ncbi:MAG: M16 family metallopeptidase [Candidatus Eiseniibacteriota bacterium]